MKLKQYYFKNHDCYKAAKKITPKGIVVHSTGANNSKLKRYVGPDDGALGVNKNGNHWNKSGSSVCVHAFIGELENGSIATYNVIPWNYRVGGCGSGPKGSHNDTHIQFEICEDGLKDKTYFNAVYKEAVELCAMLCQEYNISIDAITCHADAHKAGYASNHGDVNHWFPKHGKSMSTFRTDVAAEVKKQQTPEVTYRVRKADNSSASQTGAYSTLDNAKKECDKQGSAYRVFNGTKVVYSPVVEVSKKAYTGSFPTKTLKKGSTDKTEVKNLQKYLNWYGNYKLTVDGSFGLATEKAVKDFQKKEKLTSDGAFGPASLKAAKAVKK